MTRQQLDAHKRMMAYLPVRTHTYVEQRPERKPNVNMTRDLLRLAKEMDKTHTRYQISQKIGVSMATLRRRLGLKCPRP
jgi:hypothetical protein